MLTIILARGIAGMGSGGILTVTVRPSRLHPTLSYPVPPPIPPHPQAIIITDLVSIADRGLYQGGVNVLYGAGAATGAVLGGAVADAIGWRAAFWIQLPPIALAAGLIVAKVDVPHVKGELSAWEKFKRIDWLGCGVLVTSVCSRTPATRIRIAQDDGCTDDAGIVPLRRVLAGHLVRHAMEPPARRLAPGRGGGDDPALSAD
jgi:MFS family permease